MKYSISDKKERSPALRVISSCVASTNLQQGTRKDHFNPQFHINGVSEEYVSIEHMARLRTTLSDFGNMGGGSCAVEQFPPHKRVS
jgi:hypothetical protein